MFSQSVKSSLHQREMRLQERIHATNQASRGQRLTTHRAQSCGLSVGTSGGHGQYQRGAQTAGRPQGQPSFVPPVCAYLFIGAECSQHAERHGQKIKQAQIKKKTFLVTCSVMAFTEGAERLTSRMFFKTPAMWPQGATYIPGASKHMFLILA